MYTVGVLAFAEHVLGDVTEIELALNRRGYLVHLEQMRYDLQSTQIGYYEEDALLLWLGRCYGDRERCREIAERYVQAGVDLIVAMTAPALQVACTASTEAGIPIVFTHVTDPSIECLAAQQPGAYGNMTGVRDIWLETVEERLALIQQVVPTPTAVHAFYNPDLPAVAAEAKALRCAAKQLGLELVLHAAHSTEQVKTALATLRTSPDHALFRLSDPTVDPVTSLLGAVAHEHYIPYIGLTLDELERCGALFALDERGVGNQAAALVDRILKGAQPANLPAVAPERKVLGVNLQAAQDLGLVVSSAMLKQAQVTIPTRERTSLGAQLLLILAVASMLLGLVALATARLAPLHFIGLILAASLALALVLWIYLNRHIIHPIQRLTITAEKIGSGDVNAVIGESKVEDEIGILARAFRRMRSNLTNSYAELEKLTHSLEQRVQELTVAYRTLQETQRDLELANRRIIEADDSSRFALTTYIHDEILGPLDELTVAASEHGNPALTHLAWELEQRIRRLRFDLSVPILQDMRVELRRLVQETLPHIYPAARLVEMSLDLSAFDQVPELEPSYGFLLYRFVRGAVSNVYRHAGASHITVETAVRDGQLSLRVADDGRGFDPAEIEQVVKDGHYFFHDINIRVRQLGGTFRIASQPGAGTSLEIMAPMQPGTRRTHSEPTRHRGSTTRKRHPR